MQGDADQLRRDIATRLAVLPVPELRALDLYTRELLAVQGVGVIEVVDDAEQDRILTEIRTAEGATCTTCLDPIVAGQCGCTGCLPPVEDRP